MRLRLLNDGDLPQLMRLSAAAGWNQTEDDWRRMIRLCPDGCLGIEEEGTLAASATVVVYGGTLAWIGMVLTLPEFRGRGFARRLMERSLELCGRATIRLDASDMGKPLYESLDFVAECLVDRWRREPAQLAEPRPVEPFRFDPGLDGSVFGADRSALIRDLAQHEGARIGNAYALGRPGSQTAYFGPCVSASESEAEHLVRWFVHRHSAEPVAWDLFPGHGSAVHIAERLGFRPWRRLTRMVRSPAPVQQPDPRILAIAGFEWG